MHSSVNGRCYRVLCCELRLLLLKWCDSDCGLLVLALALAWQGLLVHLYDRGRLTGLLNSHVVPS